MRYAVVIEKGERNCSACVPDLPGCESVGDTLEEVTSEIREAIAFHLEGKREDGLPVPTPSNRAEYVEVEKQVSGAAWLAGTSPARTARAGKAEALRRWRSGRLQVRGR